MYKILALAPHFNEGPRLAYHLVPKAIKYAVALMLPHVLTAFRCWLIFDWGWSNYK